MMKWFIALVVAVAVTDEYIDVYTAYLIADLSMQHPILDYLSGSYFL